MVKGANLIRLTAAGFPVPAGFILSTSAYRFVVDKKSLESKILKILPVNSEMDLDILEKASQKIRALFSTSLLPPEIADEVT